MFGMKTFQSLYGYNENVSYLKEKQIVFGVDVSKPNLISLTLSINGTFNRK